MKKSDLKTGMIGVTRDGDLFPFVKIDGIIYRVILNTLCEFETWSHDLINTGGVGSCWDIVKVYESIIDYKNEVWEREEGEELTMEQVCKELGRNIKIKK